MKQMRILRTYSTSLLRRISIDRRPSRVVAHTMLIVASFICIFCFYARKSSLSSPKNITVTNVTSRRCTRKSLLLNFMRVQTLLDHQGSFNVNQISTLPNILPCDIPEKQKSIPSYFTDRIIDQMQYVPGNVLKDRTRGDYFVKRIYSIGNHVEGEEKFRKCPVSECTYVTDETTADVYVTKSLASIRRLQKAGQILVYAALESPYHMAPIGSSNLRVNFTMTYRRDSSIVTPYYKYTPYQWSDGPDTRYPLPKVNIALGKTKQVAWFVSNCNTPSKREDYVRSLAMHISVDIYGTCNTLKCDRFETRCFRMLQEDYKFYLSFENSKCRDYITEKFFLNALSNNVLPIVLGARKEDYLAVSPPHSFIHVNDFASPKQLAEYLQYLDKNDTAYNEYFAWHDHGLVNTNTYTACRLCMLAHEAELRHPNWYDDINHWWNSDCR